MSPTCGPASPATPTTAAGDCRPAGERLRPRCLPCFKLMMNSWFSKTRPSRRLRVLLSDTAATAAFQEAFPHLNVQSAACSYLRYKRGTSCIASFSLATPQGESLAHAIAHRSDADDKLAKAADAARRRSGLQFGPENSASGTQHLPTHDDDLPSLRFLADDGRQRSFLQRLAPSLGFVHG